LKELLATRIGALPIYWDKGDGPGEPLTPRLDRALTTLHQELAAAGCPALKPWAYWGDEWFCPEGLAAIAVPFWLAHPRLVELEASQMGRAEGSTDAELRKLLRHEAGHAFDHAYRIVGTRAFRQIFGGRTGSYRPDVYVHDDASTDFVVNLPEGYAQADPEEDFAETFAVVVTPGSDWRRRYATWPGALKKLNYVDGLIREHGRTRPRAGATRGPDCYAARRMRSTLGQFYERRRAEHAAHLRAKARLASRDLIGETAVRGIK
jgi:hypothetical protein